MIIKRVYIIYVCWLTVGLDVGLSVGQLAHTKQVLSEHGASLPMLTKLAFGSIQTPSDGQLVGPNV